jgi:hypothetical protein
MVFDLKHFQGMKLQTVSEILNISESSVKTSLMRATQKLRSQLARYTELQKSSMKRCCDQRDVSQAAIPKKEKEFMASATNLQTERPNGRTKNPQNGWNDFWPVKFTTEAQCDV